MSRLANCVETLSERVERVEEAAVGDSDSLRWGHRHGVERTRRGGGGGLRSNRAAPVDDGFTEEVLSAMHDMERRLLAAQETFQDTVNQMSARMMLMQQRLVAVETSQVTHCLRAVEHRVPQRRIAQSCRCVVSSTATRDAITQSRHVVSGSLRLSTTTCACVRMRGAELKR